MHNEYIHTKCTFYLTSLVTYNIIFMMFNMHNGSAVVSVLMMFFTGAEIVLSTAVFPQIHLLETDYSLQEKKRLTLKIQN